MALIGNRSVLHKSPGRFLSGTVASIERSNFSKAGMLANRFQSMSFVFAGIPNGHLSPSSWALPRTAGALSSRNAAGASFSTDGTAVGGVTTTGSSAIAFTVADAAGELISSGQGAATLTISTNNPLLTASIGGTGAAAFTLSTNTPLLLADASIAGTATLSLNGSLTPYAIGSMAGSTVDNTVLTSDTLANAVWSKAIEAGFSAEQILRIIAAHAAGAATGLEGANPQFVGLDGTTVRIDGAYAAGTRTIDALNGG